MEAQDEGQYEHSQNGETMSPESSSKKGLQLPMSCDPPGPANPAKQLVWIVSIWYLCSCSIECLGWGFFSSPLKPEKLGMESIPTELTL